MMFRDRFIDFVKAVAAVYDEPRSLLHLFINPADVFSQDSDSNELNTAKKQNEDDYCWIAQRKWKTEYFQRGIHSPDKEGNKSDDESKLRAQSQCVI